MELLRQMSNMQLLYPAAAVAVVLVLAAFVFIFGFHSAEQPQFDKLPLIVDDKKSNNKKKKIKEKKSSPNRTANEDAKTKSESSKKSPIKEKKEEKVKEADKNKSKETKPVESKPVKKETLAELKKGKKNKNTDVDKPADYDDGGWQEVPKKSDKKKVKSDEKDVKIKKESPIKKSKKKAKDTDIEAAHSVEETSETIKVVSVVGPDVNEESANALQAQIEELQRVLKERELLDQAALNGNDEVPVDEQLTEVKDLRSNKKKENKEKQIKKKATEANIINKNTPEAGEKIGSDSSSKQEDNVNAPVFDELGDTWTDAKTAKKSKKKVRKDQ